MARKLRYLPDPTRPVETTVRCIQGRYLLRPSETLNRRLVGVVAKSLPTEPSASRCTVLHADAGVAKRLEYSEYSCGSAPWPRRAARHPARSGFCEEAPTPPRSTTSPYTPSTP